MTDRADDFDITLPLPPKVLHPNGRTRNNGYRAAAVRKARGDSATVAKMLKPKSCPWEHASVQATFYLGRRMDGDNLNAWIKPLLDGLQDAGVVRNDSGLVLLPAQQVTGKKAGPPKVVLRIQQRVNPNRSGV